MEFFRAFTRISFISSTLGERSAKIYERCASVLHQGQWHLLVVAIFVHVGRFGVNRFPQRLFDHWQIHYHYGRPKSVHWCWCVTDLGVWNKIQLEISRLMNKCISFVGFLLFLAAVFPAIFIVAASYAGCDKLLVVIWFTLAMGFMGTFYPGKWFIHSHLCDHSKCVRLLENRCHFHSFNGRHESESTRFESKLCWLTYGCYQWHWCTNRSRSTILGWCNDTTCELNFHLFSFKWLSSQWRRNNISG